MTPFEIALSEYGHKGILGHDTNPEIEKYFDEIGHDWVNDDDTAWCAAFLNWCFMKAGRQFPGGLLARSFLSVGSMTTTPKLGDIVVLWRVTKQSQWGHAGFFVRETPGGIYILGGNQDNQVNITEYPKAKLLGYRTNYA